MRSLASPVRPLVLSAVAMVCAASHAAAQQQLAAGTVLKGVVYDSLFTKRPLAGAQIWVEGTDRYTSSDARGRWELDAVPSARHRVVAWHPRLDSAGFSAPVRLVDLTGLPSAYLTLATPSASTVYERQCPGARPRASGVLLGDVRDVGTEVLSAGVVVEARWSEYGIGRAAAAPADRVVRAITDDDGRFRLCGVPNDVAVALVAFEGGRAAGPVEVHLRQRQVGTERLALGRRVVAAGSGAALQGRVLAADGRALADAEVRMLGRSASARSDPSGNFELADLAGGSHTLEVRAIGFAPRRVTLVLQEGEARFRELVLEKSAIALPEIAVTGRAPSPLDLSGFEIRRRGGRGYFMDEAAIRRRRASTTADLFNGIPGVEVVLAGSAGVVVFRRAEGQIGKYNRGVCSPQYFVDGVARQVGTEDPVSGEFNPIGRVLDQVGLFNPDVGPGQLARVEELAAIEIYRGTADAPPQYSKLDAGCGVILLWTKRGKPTASFRAKDEIPADPLPERTEP